jgi:uncharacterized glyoxalase superfamily protein PhnB
MTSQTPAPQVWPGLAAIDAHKLIAFLVEAFGFVETAVHGEGDRVDHAELAWPPGGGVMLGSVRATEDVFYQPPGTAALYAITDDPDALYTRAVAAGATVILGPIDTDYGSREFAVRDPEGNRWSFGTYRGAPRPD